VSNTDLIKPIDEADKQKELDQWQLRTAVDESIYNGTVISWRYWVEQMPQLSAAEAARLMSALDPDLFKSLDHRPNKNDPTKRCEKAAMIQRLAERQDMQVATPAEWLAWSIQEQIKVHDGFRLAVESLTTQPDTKPTTAAASVVDAITDPCARFREMGGITANELTIVISGDKDSSGLLSTNSLVITAQGITKKVTLASLNLIDLHRNRVNYQGLILLGMAQGRKTSTAEKKNTKRVERLRKSLRANLGITDDPLPYTRGKGWEPSFTVRDSRGMAAARAEHEALKRSDSLEQSEADGKQFTGFDKNGEPISREAAEFLSQNSDDNW
jgi:hypothetical protein